MLHSSLDDLIHHVRESCAGAPRYGGREKSWGTGNEGISSQFPHNKKYQMHRL